MQPSSVPHMFPSRPWVVQDLFLLHYGTRNPWRRRRFSNQAPASGEAQAGITAYWSPQHGVRDMAVVIEYAEALQQAYSELTGHLFGWPALQCLPRDVYIYSMAGGTVGYAMPVAHGGFIGLHSGGSEARLMDATDRRKATAVHELAHLFQFDAQPPPTWRGFNEATACATASFILDQNPTHFRNLPAWFFRPEESLDASTATCGYRQWLFIAYLFRRFGPELITNVYMRHAATGSRDPMVVLAQVIESLEAGVVLASAADDDVFSLGFCPDAYFLNDPEAELYYPELFQRFGERAVADSFVDYPVVKAAGKEAIHHLGCRYYRFRPQEGKSALSVTVQFVGGSSEQLRGELIGVSADMCRRSSERLVRDPACNGMRAEVTGFSCSDLDHAVLVLANCAHGDGWVDHDDVTFTISAELA